MAMRICQIGPVRTHGTNTGTARMIGTDSNETGLGTVYQLGGDWLWFFLAVIAGLLLAAWLGGLALDGVMIAPGARG